MRAQIHDVGGPGVVSEATLFQQAQAGCSASLNGPMACHEGLVQAIVRQQVLGDLPSHFCAFFPSHSGFPLRKPAWRGQVRRQKPKGSRRPFGF